MQHEHENTITANKHNKLKTRFSHLLQHPAWKQSGPILKGKKKREE